MSKYECKSTLENVEKARRVLSRKSRTPCSARVVPSENFCATLNANVDNDNMTDADFRAFVKNTLPIVQFDVPNA